MRAAASPTRSLPCAIFGPLEIGGADPVSDPGDLSSSLLAPQQESDRAFRGKWQVSAPAIFEGPSSLIGRVSEPQKWSPLFLETL